jgi:hypothetical protein
VLTYPLLVLSTRDVGRPSLLSTLCNATFALIGVLDVMISRESDVLYDPEMGPLEDLITAFFAKRLYKTHQRSVKHVH